MPKRQEINRIKETSLLKVEKENDTTSTNGTYLWNQLGGGSGTGPGNMR